MQLSSWVHMFRLVLPALAALLAGHRLRLLWPQPHLGVEPRLQNCLDCESLRLCPEDLAGCIFCTWTCCLQLVLRNVSCNKLAACRDKLSALALSACRHSPGPGHPTVTENSGPPLRRRRPVLSVASPRQVARQHFPKGMLRVFEHCCHLPCLRPGLVSGAAPVTLTV